MKTQAWGWLAAGVLAAGLNATYHDGGLEWGHNVAARVEHNTAAVLALATGRADRFLTEARIVTAQSQAGSCPLATVLAEAQTSFGSSANEWDGVRAMSDRREAELARLEASRARLEAQIAAQLARVHVDAVGFSSADFHPVKVSLCPRLRLNMPRPPAVKIPARVIHIDLASAGPV